MKRLTLISLVLLAAVLLSACTAGASATTWPGLAADTKLAYLADGSYVYAVRLSDGAKSWQYPAKAGTQLFYANPVLTSDGQLLVGSAGHDYELNSLDITTGQPKWTAPFVGTDRWVASPLVVGDTVYAANNDGTLYVLKLATGDKLWSLHISQELWGAPVTDGKLIFVTSLDHFLYAVDPIEHTIVWKVNLGGSAPGSPVVSSDGKTLYVGSFAKKVFAVDIASGSVRWTADTKVYSPNEPLPNLGGAWPGLSYFLICTADGSVHAIVRTEISEKDLRAAIIINDGQIPGRNSSETSNNCQQVAESCVLPEQEQVEVQAILHRLRPHLFPLQNPHCSRRHHGAKCQWSQISRSLRQSHSEAFS